MEKSFNSESYIKLQSEKIRERIKMFGNKLYLEFGGKLIDDYHAMRVLPGFEPDIKIKMLKELKDQAEVIFCINANDIEKNKIRADHGISYDLEVIRLIEYIRSIGLTVNSVVITLYNNQSGIDKFRNKLKSYNIDTYLHTFTKGYPTDVDTIVSEEGYGANPYIKTTKPLVVVSAPGPCSGKLATCLSQLYHEYKNGVNAGYAKFETFPVWSLPLKHPVNIAYEAATADLNDKNMIDYFHLEKYGITSVNYNRDLEVFPVLKTILNKITGKDIYFSPTDMGVNVIGKCIEDDNAVCEASKNEIIRRYYRAMNDYKLGTGTKEICDRIKLLMNELEISEDDREVVQAAINKSKEKNSHAVAIKLKDGTLITGRKTDLLSPVSSAIINAIKVLTKIPDEVFLLSPSVLEPIKVLKEKRLKKVDATLELDEVLISLSICSVTNPIVEKALKNLDKLRGCEAHSTYIVPRSDLELFNNLGINLTSETEFYDSKIQI